MDNLTGEDNIREKMAAGKMAKKKTMSVPEMRELLGIHSSNLYEIWRDEKLETFTVDFTKRFGKEYEDVRGNLRSVGFGRNPKGDSSFLYFILLWIY